MREGPASGRTVYRLQAHPAAGTVQLAADGDHQLRVCVDCMRAHQHGHLPPLSYACVDNGLRPSHLPQLTVMEERLVAVWRPLRNLMVCRPPAAGGGPGHWEMRAHVIAFKAPEPQQLAAVFPCSLARVPECITVVFVSPAQTYQQLEALARRVPALMVRGKVVAAWARHLAALYPSARLDEAAVQEWERQPPTAVADTLARRAVCTQTQGEASALLRTLRAEQEGYARARYGTAEEAAARGASTAMAVAVNSDSSSGSDSEAIIVQQSLARPSRKRPRLLSAAHMQRLLCGLDRDASVAVRQLLLAHNFKAAATKLLRHHDGAPTKEAVTQMQVQLQTQHCNYEQVRGAVEAPGGVGIGCGRSRRSPRPAGRGLSQGWNGVGMGSTSRAEAGTWVETRLQVGLQVCACVHVQVLTDHERALIAEVRRWGASRQATLHRMWHLCGARRSVLT